MTLPELRYELSKARAHAQKHNPGTFAHQNIMLHVARLARQLRHREERDAVQTQPETPE